MYIIGTQDGQPNNSTVSFVRPSDPLKPQDPNIETLELSGTMAQIHLVKLRADAFVVSDTSGNVGYARQVQQISYSDQNVMVSTVPVAGNVDQALTQIYLAAFRRAPETEGYNYWMGEQKTRGLIGTADTIFNIESVQNIYPVSMTSSQFVTEIYRNVFDRAPDTEGLNYWTTQLNSKSRGQLVIDITTAALGTEEGTPGKDFFENRLDWSLYAVSYQQTHTEIAPDRLIALTNTVNDMAATTLKLVGQGEAGVLM